MNVTLAELEALPGGDVVARGLAELAAGRLGVEALLVLVGASRLRRAGLEVPWVDVTRPEHALYRELEQRHGDAAHGKYNALIRRLVSFERALECVIP